MPIYGYNYFHSFPYFFGLYYLHRVLEMIYMQISKASLVPKSSYIAKPAASWLDDFLVWVSPEAFGCCRKFTNGTFCPPDDQVY